MRALFFNVWIKPKSKTKQDKPLVNEQWKIEHLFLTAVPEQHPWEFLLYFQSGKPTISLVKHKHKIYWQQFSWNMGDLRKEFHYLWRINDTFLPLTLRNISFAFLCSWLLQQLCSWQRICKASPRVFQSTEFYQPTRKVRLVIWLLLRPTAVQLPASTFSIYGQNKKRADVQMILKYASVYCTNHPLKGHKMLQSYISHVVAEFF